VPACVKAETRAKVRKLRSRLGPCTTGRTRPWTVLAHTAAGFLLGCAPVPQRLIAPYPAALPPRHELGVWTGDSVLHLHGIRFHQDSVTGVSILKPPSCDSCRVGVPLSAVDSLITGSSERDAIILTALPVLALLAFGVAFALNSGGD
jgi:hypothetical protein